MSAALRTTRRYSGLRNGTAQQMHASNPSYQTKNCERLDHGMTKSWVTSSLRLFSVRWTLLCFGPLHVPRFVRLHERMKCMFYYESALIGLKAQGNIYGDLNSCVKKKLKNKNK